MAQISDTTLISDGNLDAYWKFEDNSLDETANNADGTDTNISYVTGKFGKSADFTNSPSTSKIALPDQASLEPSGSYSIGGWFKTTGTGARFCFASFSANPNVAGFRFNITAAGEILWRHGNNTGTIQGTHFNDVLSSGATARDGDWHLIICVYNGSTMKIYFDNSEVGSESWSTAAAWAATSYNYICGTSDDGVGFAGYDGEVDDMFLFSKALSSTEMDEIWNEATPKVNAARKMLLGVGV